MSPDSSETALIDYTPRCASPAAVQPEHATVGEDRAIYESSSMDRRLASRKRFSSRVQRNCATCCPAGPLSFAACTVVDVTGVPCFSRSSARPDRPRFEDHNRRKIRRFPRLYKWSRHVPLAFVSINGHRTFRLNASPGITWTEM